MIKKIIESKIFEKDIFYILCTAFFYAIFVFLWHYNNNALPTSDAITYLEDAYSKYYKFYDAGFIEGLINLYTSRGWRPQIYAAIIAPFLILTQGDVLLSITIFSSLSAFCLAFILYKILKIKLTPLNSSLLTLFILITPNIYTIYTSFFSEIIYMPFALSVFYFLFKSENFTIVKNVKYSAIFLALTICIRPAETIIFILAIIPFVYIAINKKTISFNSVFSSINIIFITIIMIFYITYILPSNKPFLYITILFCFFTLFYIMRFLKSDYYKKNCFVQFTSLTCIISFIYWIPAIDKLLIWTYEASSGSVAESLAWHMRSRSLIVSLEQFFRAYGNVLIPLLFSVPLILIKKNIRNAFNESTLIALVSSILLILFLFLSYTFFLNDGQIVRRSLLSFFLVSIFLSWLIFNKHMKHNNISIILVFFLTLYSFFYTYSAAISSTKLSSYTKKIYNYSHDNINYALNSSKFMSKDIISYFNYKKKFYHIKSDSREDKHILLSNIMSKNACIYDPENCLKGEKIFFSMPLLYNADTIDPFTAAFVNNSLSKNNFWVGYVLIRKDDEPLLVLKDKKINYIIVEINEKYSKDIINKRGKIGSAERFTSVILNNYYNKKNENLILVDKFKVNSSNLLLFKINN